MKSKKKTLKLTHFANSRYFRTILIVIFAVVATTLISTSNAAQSYNNEPFGVADYCRLEGGSTVIYGWAHDSQAEGGSNPWVNITIGSRTLRVATNIDGYRNAEINDYLSKNNYKTASGYGFRASFSNIYKGSNPAISAIVENVQAGNSNQPMRINQSTPINSGPPDKYYFANYKVPEACLADAPVVPAPSPSPNPSPAPSPSPGTSSSAPVNQPSPSAPTATGPSTNTDETNSIPVTLQLKLVKGDAVIPDIPVSMEELSLTATTDGDGVATFPEVPRGEYTLSFIFQDYPYQQIIEIEGASATGTKVEKTIDVDTIEPTSSTGTESDGEELASSADGSGSSPVGLIVFIVLLLVAAGTAVLLLIRRRRGTEYYDEPVAPQPVYQAPAPPTVAPTQPQYQRPPTPPGSHIGVSLKDLVIDSMREEAARRRDNDKQ